MRRRIRLSVVPAFRERVHSARGVTHTPPPTRAQSIAMRTNRRSGTSDYPVGLDGGAVRGVE